MNQGIDELLIRFGITKPTDMQRELFSRDFTCNALLLSFDLIKYVRSSASNLITISLTSLVWGPARPDALMKLRWTENRP